MSSEQISADVSILEQNEARMLTDGIKTEVEGSGDFQ